MNLDGNKIQKLIILFFLIGLVGSIYMLYALPGSLEKNSMSIGFQAISDVTPLLIRTSVVIILTLLLGLAYIIQTQRMQNAEDDQQEVFYIEDTEVDLVKGESSDKKNKINVEEIVSSISKAVQQKKTTQSKFDALLQRACDATEACQGVLYQTKKEGFKRRLEMVSAFAFSLPESERLSYEFGEGLVGQAAMENKTKKLDEIPEGYMTIVSGLGTASPNYLMIKPYAIDGEVEALIEIASFAELNEDHDEILAQSLKLIEQELLENQQVDTTEIKEQPKKTTKTETTTKKVAKKESSKAKSKDVKKN